MRHRYVDMVLCGITSIQLQQVGHLKIVIDKKSARASQLMAQLQTTWDQSACNVLHVDSRHQHNLNCGVSTFGETNQLHRNYFYRKVTIQSRVLMRITNQEINFLSKGHSTQGLKIPFISNLKKPACASKRDVLELATLR